MSFSQSKGPVPLSLNKEGKLVYIADELGNRIPDFSYCGYMASEKIIPDVDVKVIVPCIQSDATTRIQAAIDYVSRLSADENGFRGAVLLDKGIHEVSGGLRINQSGIVIRGCGMGDNGTVILATGKDRRTFITITGKYDREQKSVLEIQEEYVPVNAFQLQLTTNHGLKAGDNILIQRIPNQEWIIKLGMDYFGGETDWLRWKENERITFWDRKVVAVDGNIITIDAPLTCAIEKKYGGGKVIHYTWDGRISQVGIENLRLESEYNKVNPIDEEHCWFAITMDNIQDSWVRQVAFKHFAGSAVALYDGAKRITVNNCKSLSPVSEIGGARRYTFFTEGQQTLFQNCYAEFGYHDFATGFCAAGPNAFVQCESHLPYSFSGAIDSWSTGILFDIMKVDGNNLCYSNRGADDSGAGWCAANSVFWQCSASRIECYKPPTANNWAFGIWAQYAGDGYWHGCNEHVNPGSLFYAQLSDRLGYKIINRVDLMPFETETTSNPSPELAMELTKNSVVPALQLSEWIDQAAERNPISITSKKSTQTIDKIGIPEKAIVSIPSDIKIENGWLTYKESIITGNRHQVEWWRGDPRPYDRNRVTPHITRFVPGRYEMGLTDNIDEVADWMKQMGIVAVDYNYGLWYERRRDDHVRVRRGDGEVWPPFYELPFARSGQGTAWDGLSKYDLTKYNHWYWMRLKQFADIADQKGLVLLHQNYFQHNILEAGAHWADFPWRTANNINNTGFPEPPPYAGDKRIFMAEQFYDISDPQRRELHRLYIRQCLNNFSDNSSVIQFISAEFSGPLHFVEFWLDVIKEWEKETGKEACIALSVSKDVQDAILNDPVRSKIVNVIDIRYWSYREDSTLFAQPGGQNLAPRQYARQVKPGKRSFDQVYRSVREYKDKFPEKAVMYSEGNYTDYAWAAFMAGGSLTSIPKVENEKFLLNAASMRPADLMGQPWMHYVLKNEKEEYIVYNDTYEPVRVILAKALENGYDIYWINPEDGKIMKTLMKQQGGHGITLDKVSDKPEIIWVTEGE
ncbi:MAG: pectate lyase [Bacteroidales bacterium]|nr:pectate lyase [Bacteroidales bacterium]